MSVTDAIPAARSRVRDLFTPAEELALGGFLGRLRRADP